MRPLVTAFLLSILLLGSTGFAQQSDTAFEDDAQPEMKSPQEISESDAFENAPDSMEQEDQNPPQEISESDAFENAPDSMEQEDGMQPYGE